MSSQERYWEFSNRYNCNGKRSYETWKQAQTANNHVLKNGSTLKAKGKKIERLHVYKCKNCGYFHIGHAPRRVHPRLRPYSRREENQIEE